MIHSISCSKACIDRLADCSPKFLIRCTSFAFAVAIICTLAGVLAIVGHAVPLPLLAKLSPVAGITLGATLVALGFGLSIALPILLKKVLHARIEKTLAALEKEKKEGRISSTEYSLRTMHLRFMRLKLPTFPCFSI